MANKVDCTWCAEALPKSHPHFLLSIPLVTYVSYVTYVKRFLMFIIALIIHLPYLQWLLIQMNMRKLGSFTLWSSILLVVTKWGLVGILFFAGRRRQWDWLQNSPIVFCLFFWKLTTLIAGKLPVSKGVQFGFNFTSGDMDVLLIIMYHVEAFTEWPTFCR